MSYFYLDTSALVKRYIVETGTNWVVSLTSPENDHTIGVSEITRVEAAAAIAARHRGPDGTTREERDEAVSLLLVHFDTEYEITPLNPEIIGRAVNLTQNHRLRGYDAIQLATALAANDSLAASNLSALTFIAADEDLVSAARVEGLSADDPNRHP